MKRKLKITSTVLFIFFIIVELVGRYYGLHSFPLYISSKNFEYIYAPNQKLQIYRNHFYTNEFSMRSLPFSEEKDTTVVLLIGDSLVNGGNLIDNDSLGTTILEKKITKTMGRSVRVLNVSAGSWGPDNAAAYIEQYGLFNAKLVVLVVNSLDAYDNMTKSDIVGIHPQYPNKNYHLAWGKLIERGGQYINDKFTAIETQNKFHQALGINEGKEFNPGFNYFDSLTKNKNIPFLIYIHPMKEEVNKNKLNSSGKEIVRFCKENDIKLIKELDYGIDISYYRDFLHYNQKGQKFLAKNLYPIILKELHSQ